MEIINIIISINIKPNRSCLEANRRDEQMNGCCLNLTILTEDEMQPILMSFSSSWINRRMISQSHARNHRDQIRAEWNWRLVQSQVIAGWHLPFGPDLACNCCNLINHFLIWRIEETERKWHLLQSVWRKHSNDSILIS